MTRTILLSVGFWISQAATSVPALSDEKAVISPVGYKRLKENRELLDGNIRDVQRNISVSIHNVQTLQSEVKDLDGLLSQGVGLKEKYLKYLANATQETTKNEKAIARLDKWEKELNASGFGNNNDRKAEYDALMRERADRERWRADAKAKVDRINEILRLLHKNDSDIKARRKPLVDQVGNWEVRQKNYQKVLSALQTTKSEYEKQIK